jgi:hypothetical protein
MDISKNADITQPEKNQVKARLGHLLFEKSKLFFNEMQYSSAARVLDESMNYHLTKVSLNLIKLTTSETQQFSFILRYFNLFLG